MKNNEAINIIKVLNDRYLTFDTKEREALNLAMVALKRCDNTTTGLKNIRLSRNMTQAKLAELSGVNLRGIQHYEQGSHDINHASIDTLKKLSFALDCDVLALLNSSQDEVKMNG